MFALIHHSNEGVHDVCKTSSVYSDNNGKYILRNRRKVRISLLCTNESEIILNEIKEKINADLPGVVASLYRKSEGKGEDQESIDPYTYNNYETPCTMDTDQGSDVLMPRSARTSVKRRLFVEDNKFSTEFSTRNTSDADSDSEPFCGDDIVDPDFKLSPSKYEISSSDEGEDNENERQREFRKKDIKKNCCVYCKQLFSKITPHLERRHAEEPEVRKFINLPKGTPGRKQIIDTLRKQGNFLYAADSDSIISVRKINTNRKHCKPCPNCKGFYSITSLRKHFKRCNPNVLQNKRRLLVMSRKLQLGIHPKASYVLKNEVFPVLREDAITDQIRDDGLVIIYGNKLCEKYKSKHLHKMIRARMRLIGRFLIDIKKEENLVSDFASVFHPKFFDSTIKSINSVAQLDQVTGKYKSPATAFALGTSLKFTANTLISECIKNGEPEKKKNVQDFLKLLHNELATAVNKTVSENQLEYKRQKKVKLPTNDDIKKLYQYLTNERRKFFQICQSNFSKESWLKLAGYTLISMQLFNRRRAGEIERIFLEDFRCQEHIDEQDDLFKSLSDTSKAAAKQYARFTIRGKLARGVPVLLHKEVFECVELLLEKRSEVGMPEENPYLFGIPHIGKTHDHLNAYKLLVEFSQRCGAKEPKTLRGTGLRKHIATQCILLDLKETEVKDLANYLGHAEKIHFDHYRMPITARDITVMSRLLEKAQGTDDLLSDLPTTDVSEENVATTSKTAKEQNEAEVDDISETDYYDDVLQINEKASKNQNDVKRTPTKKPKTRLAWITPERQAIKRAFSEHIAGHKLPSFNECRKAQETYPILKRRSLPQIKSHISNEIKRRTTVR